MNNSDLRVIKTKESIEAAFLEMMKKKPLEKITVVELAKKARISKGTFYLHYEDVYDLNRKLIMKVLRNALAEADFFELFFDEPARFNAELESAIFPSISVLDVLTKGKPNLVLLSETLEIIRQKLYETGRIEKSIENDIRLDALFSGIFVCRPIYEAEHKKEMDDIANDLIKTYNDNKVICTHNG